MRNALSAIIFLLLVSLSGCAGQGEDDVFVVSERFFVNQMMEIVVNHSQYEGRTIKLEGLFREVNGQERDFFVVLRFADGCCGPEPVGLEVVLNGLAQPEDDAWVEAVGVLTMQGGLPVLILTSLTELLERGQEFV